jgi:hypothetical protein
MGIGLLAFCITILIAVETAKIYLNEQYHETIARE